MHWNNAQHTNAVFADISCYTAKNAVDLIKQLKMMLCIILCYIKFSVTSVIAKMSCSRQFNTESLRLTCQRCFGDVCGYDTFPNSIRSLLEDFSLEVTWKLRVDWKDSQWWSTIQLLQALYTSKTTKT